MADDDRETVYSSSNADTGEFNICPFSGATHSPQGTCHMCTLVHFARSKMSVPSFHRTDTNVYELIKRNVEEELKEARRAQSFIQLAFGELPRAQQETLKSSIPFIEEENGQRRYPAAENSGKIEHYEVFKDEHDEWMDAYE